LKDYVQAKDYIDKAVYILQRLPADHPYLKGALEWQEKIEKQLAIGN
jgi:hypothetical protein